MTEASVIHTDNEQGIVNNVETFLYFLINKKLFPYGEMYVGLNSQLSAVVYIILFFLGYEDNSITNFKAKLHGSS